MPKIDRKLIARKADIVSDLKKIIKTENILYHEDQTRPFETDALSAYKQKPLAVVLPENIAQVKQVLKICKQHDTPVVTRGAGTGLAGGAIPLENSVVLGLSKLSKIKTINAEGRSTLRKVFFKRNPNYEVLGVKVLFLMEAGEGDDGVRKDA